MIDNISHDSSIVRVVEVQYSVSMAIEIQGLNIFDENKIYVDKLDEPKNVLFRSLILECACAAQIGFSAIDISYESVEEVLGNVDNTTWQPSQVGIIGSEFYCLPNIETNGILIDDVKGFFDRQIGQDSVFNTIVSYDALALYVNCKPSVASYIALLKSKQFINDSDWMSYCLNHCEAIVIPVNDAKVISVFMNSRYDNKIIKESIALATSAIRESRWYTENQKHLVWSDSKMCLVLP